MIFPQSTVGTAMSPSESDLTPHNPEQKVGLPPGSVVFVGEERTEPVEFQVLEYGSEHLVEADRESVEEVLKYRDTEPVTWGNIAGVHDASVVQTVGDHFRIHPLIQEDIAHTGQRPKLDP